MAHFWVVFADGTTREMVETNLAMAVVNLASEPHGPDGLVAVVDVERWHAVKDLVPVQPDADEPKRRRK